MNNIFNEFDPLHKTLRQHHEYSGVELKRQKKKKSKRNNRAECQIFAAAVDVCVATVWSGIFARAINFHLASVGCVAKRMLASRCAAIKPKRSCTDRHVDAIVLFGK